LVWACTGNGRKYDSQKSIIYEFGNNKIERQTKKKWQDEVREDGRIVAGEGWQEKVHNREEWKKCLRTARNRQILHVPVE
jgi:hypothetical protein